MLKTKIGLGLWMGQGSIYFVELSLKFHHHKTHNSIGKLSKPFFFSFKSLPYEEIAEESGLKQVFFSDELFSS